MKNFWIKLFDYVLGGLLISLAWSLRGQFGHLKGALIPGALAALLIVILHRDEIWRRSFGLAVVLGSLGFALGGHFSYGKLIESVLAAPSLIVVLPELFHLFLIGALWGGLGMTFLGLACSEKSLIKSDLILIGCLGFLWLIPFSPWDDPIFNLILFGAGLLAIHLYNGLLKHSRIVTLLGQAGFVGFGSAFLIAVVLLYGGLHGWFLGAGEWWSLRDQIIGLIGGLTIVFAIHQCQRFDLFPNRATISLGSEKAGFFFWLAVIPFINGLNTIGYWAWETSKVTNTQMILLIVAMSLFFGMISIGLSRISLRSFTDKSLDRLFYGCFLFFIWFLSIAAISKETFVDGWERWETAYSFFLILSLTLSILMPFRINRGR